MTQPVNHPLDPSYGLTFQALPTDMITWKRQGQFGDNGASNGEIETYRPDNVFLGTNNDIVLQGRNIGGGDATILTYGVKYTSGFINSHDIFSFRYGYLEVFAKLPTGYGVWPAIWLLLTNVAQTNEIDMVEIFQNPTQVNCGVHFPGGATHDGGPYTTPDVGQDYHAYAIDWKPNYLQFYFDGIPLFRTQVVSEVPNALMYLMMNVAISGSATGNNVPGDFQFPLNMSVQYARLWQPDNPQFLLQYTPQPNYGNYEAAVTCDGAFTQYHLGDTVGLVAHDTIGGRDATISATGVTLGQQSITNDGNGSMLFDGTAGNIVTPIDLTGYTSFTVEVWFMFLPTNHGGRVVASGHTDSTHTGLEMSIDPTPTGGVISLGTVSTNSALYYTYTFQPFTPYYMVATYDGTFFTGYINGVQMGQGAISGAVASSGFPINIGRGPYSGGTDYFQGLISHVSFYVNALLPGQVLDHYITGIAPSTVVPSLPTTSSNLIVGPSPCDIGKTVRCWASFIVNRVLADPTVLTVRVKSPSGAVSYYTYGSDYLLFKDGTGIYHFDLKPDVAGTWIIQCVGTDVLNGSFVVNAPPFP